MQRETRSRRAVDHLSDRCPVRWYIVYNQSSSTTMRTRTVALAFGRVLREARLERGISQDALASLCDFDRTYPSLLERGLRSPTLAMILRIAEALDLNPSLLVGKTYDELRRQS